MEATAARVVSKRIKKRCWLLISFKKRYSLAAKTNMHDKKIMMYFIFIKIYLSYKLFRNVNGLKFIRQCE
jgi:hypothetical protein